MVAIVALSGILGLAAGVLPSLYKGKTAGWQMRV
jgi:hypothetical protein